jgi:hypothetical protein
MINGVYKFYLDGEYIGQKSNSITVAGRAIILKSIMGLVPTVGGEIHFGIGNTANGATDPSTGLITRNTLDFDVASSQVRLSYLDNSGAYDAMVFKTSFGANGSSGEKYTIYELGLFPGTGNEATTSGGRGLLFQGAQTDAWFEGNTEVPLGSGSNSCYMDTATATTAGYSFRVGNTALFIKSGDILTVNGPFTGYNFYNSADKLAIAYSKLSAGTQTITMKFHTNSLNYFTAAISTSAGTTYGIGEKTFQEMTTAKTGFPSWDNISYITITASGDTLIDAIRFNDVDNLDTSYGMVSRAVLNTPIVKQQNQTLDVEYYLSLGFNKTVT